MIKSILREDEPQGSVYVVSGHLRKGPGIVIYATDDLDTMVKKEYLSQEQKEVIEQNQIYHTFERRYRTLPFINWYRKQVDLPIDIAIAQPEDIIICPPHASQDLAKNMMINMLEVYFSWITDKETDEELLDYPPDTKYTLDSVEKLVHFLKEEYFKPMNTFLMSGKSYAYKAYEQNLLTITKDTPQEPIIKEFLDTLPKTHNKEHLMQRYALAIAAHTNEEYEKVMLLRKG